MLACPDIIREGFSVCVDHGLNVVIHDGERLSRPEVTSGIGEMIVFE